MNMLDLFFSIQHKDDSSLFEGLSIWKEEKYRELQGTYPVIFLSFADVKAASFAEARESICMLIEDVYQSNGSLLEEGALNEKKY